MSIYICTPTSFFNIIQKYNYHVYDFRIDHSKQLKNTTLVPHESWEQYITINRRQYCFLLPFEQSDKFTFYLQSKLIQQQYSIQDILTIYEQYQIKQHHHHHKIHRALTTCIQSQQSQQQTEQIIHNNNACTNPKFHTIINRSLSAPSKQTLYSTYNQQCNHAVFNQTLNFIHYLQNNKIRLIYLILEPSNILFTKYPFLNYNDLKNRGYLNKTYPNEILPNKLYLGSAEHAQDTHIIEECLKITHILNATIEVPNYSTSAKYLNIKIYDEPQVQIKQYFQDVYDFIDQPNAVVLVHCAQGKSRSAAFVVMYLMRKLSLSFQDAYQYVRDRRDIVEINDGFIQQLQQ